MGAKYEIYLLLWKLAAMGKGIIIVSSDLPEMLGIYSNLRVVQDGRSVFDTPEELADSAWLAT